MMRSASRAAIPGEGSQTCFARARRTGTTPIRDALQLPKRERHPLMADIEYDYGGASDPLREVANCLAFSSGSNSRFFLIETLVAEHTLFGECPNNLRSNP